jgi:hypothetical protein
MLSYVRKPLRIPTLFIKENKRMNKKYHVLLFVGFIALTVLAFTGCKKETKEQAQGKEQVKVDESIAAKPLPDSAFRSEIILLKPVQGSMKADSTFSVQLRVKNISNTVWPSGENEKLRRVNLGYRWFDKDGKQMIKEGGRVFIPKDLSPGEKIDLQGDIQALSTPGEYKLVFEMVQERVGWFASKGSKTAKVNVKIY